MLSEDLLIVHQIAQADICTFDALQLFLNLDNTRRRRLVSTMRTCIEESNPTQAGIDYLVTNGYMNGSPGLREIFRSQPCDKAIAYASEVADDGLGQSFDLFIVILRHFDELMRKTVCKNGCDHEGHNLNWNIRTEDIEKVAEFYSLFGFELTRHTYPLGYHYSIRAGQALLKIQSVRKTQPEKGLTLRIRFILDDFEGVIKKLGQKQVPFVIEHAQAGTGVMATVIDPDGRKIRLYKTDPFISAT